MASLHELIRERAPELATGDAMPVECEQPRELAGVLILQHEKGDVQEQQGIDRLQILTAVPEHAGANASVPPKSSADNHVLQPLETERLAFCQTVTRCDSRRHFEDILRVASGRYAGTRICLAWRDIPRDIDDAPLIVHPDHHQWNERVLHPARIVAALREEEDHAPIRSELIAKHQSLRANGVIGGDLHLNHEVVGKDDARTGRRGGGAGLGGGGGWGGVVHAAREKNDCCDRGGKYFSRHSFSTDMNFEVRMKN